MLLLSFVVFCFFQYLAKKLAGKNVSETEMTYFCWMGRKILLHTKSCCGPKTLQELLDEGYCYGRSSVHGLGVGRHRDTCKSDLTTCQPV